MRIAAKIKLKHGDLQSLLDRHGLSQADFARLCGWKYPVRFGQLINLKRRPSMVEINTMQEAFATLGEVLDVCEMWPENFAGLKITETVQYRDIPDQLLLAEPSSDGDVRMLYEAMDECLDPRERLILNMHTEGSTLVEMADTIGRSRDRCAKLRDQAMRKVRDWIEYEDENAEGV